MILIRFVIVASLCACTAACLADNDHSIRTLERLCDKGGEPVVAVRPSDEVVATARSLNIDADIEALGKSTTDSSVGVVLETKLIRLKAQQPDIDKLELELYLLASSYCNGGLTIASYQELVDRAHRRVLTAIDKPTEKPTEQPKVKPKEKPTVQRPRPAESGEITFYEGNGGTQDVVHETDDSPGQYFKPRVNDEARSVVLRNVRKGCKVTVYDNSDGKKSDDYCVITVLQSSNRYVVSSFERSYTDAYVKVAYKRRDNLDGKVSRIRVE